MAESRHPGLERLRRPHVHLAYQRAGGTALPANELPFIVGVLGDFSGNPTQTLQPLREREFIPVDRDHFDEIMRQITPALRFNAENTLAGDGTELLVELKFDRMSDFGPASIARQVPDLRKLLEAREKLQAIRDRADRSGRVEGLLEQFLAFGQFPQELQPVRDILRPLARQADKNPQARQEVRDTAGDAMLRIDGLLTRQINRIIHDPCFQKIEASWRGLRYLVDRADPGENVHVRVLNVTWAELAADMERALEFDATALFRKVSRGAVGTPPGEPFGVLIGDYEITHQTTDVAALESVSQVAAAAFAPFITSAHPSLLGLASFADLDRPLDLARMYESPEFGRWRSFRSSKEARFVGVTLPRVLMRLPYHQERHCAQTCPEPVERTSFAFSEEIDSANDYLWGNAAYAFAAILARAFGQSHWLADIRGVRRAEEGGGIVTGLPIESFATEPQGIALKFSTDVVVTDPLDRILGDLGLIALCRCKGTQYSAFHGNRSVQEIRITGDIGSGPDPRTSAMLQNILCAARIAHYVRAISRAEIGSCADAMELRNRLSLWLGKLTLDDVNAAAEARAVSPLRAAEISVWEQPGGPGCYFCEMLLSPHAQSDERVAGVRLAMELVAGK
jgi:type VI secretion system protein ImpC